MLKSIVCLCLFALVSANAFKFELNEQATQFLSKIRMADLPESVQKSLTKATGRAGDSSHWCCINEQPVTTDTQTKVEYATRVVATKTRVGYVDCGFLGTMKCSHYVTSYRQELQTFIQTFQVPNMAACNSHEVKCCSGYMLIAENCHSYADLVANQELFQFLNSLGLFSAGVGK